MIEPVTFLVWTENSPGVLLRLTTLFTRRKVNVESLTVSATETEGVSRFTVVVNLDPALAATVGRQIERMVEVRRVFVFTESEIVHREVALFRVAIPESAERELLERYAEARIINRQSRDVLARDVLIQFTGTESEISSLLEEMKSYGLREFVRSGRVAVTETGEFERDLSRSLHEMRPFANEGPDF